jgi:hypothetical protein
MFITWNVLEWIIFVAAVLWALGTNLNVRKHYKASKTPVIPANTFAFVQAVSVVFILVLRYSPLNLIWLFLLSYVAGYFALRIEALRWTAWAYGYLIALSIPSNWAAAKEAPSREEHDQKTHDAPNNEKAPRQMLFIWGVAEILAALGISFFSSGETGVLYWVTAAIFAILMLSGLICLKDGFFASDADIRKKMTGGGRNDFEPKTRNYYIERIKHINDTYHVFLIAVMILLILQYSSIAVPEKNVMEGILVVVTAVFGIPVILFW